MAGRRGARTGRGWDAAPPRARRQPRSDQPELDKAESGAEPIGRAGRGRYAGRRGEAAEKPEPERAREICLRLLQIRPRTRAELATALRQRGISDDVAAEILERYSEVGMVDDQAFAKAWVSSRHHGRGLSRRALAGELWRKGVEPEAVTAALDELDPETEAATARALVDRKLRTERGTNEATLRRLVAMLARKGYPPGLAIRVVKEALADQPSELLDELDDLRFE
jgi:regulatory protein